MNRSPLKRTKQKPYSWDDEKGVVVWDRKQKYHYQAIQLLHSPASMAFRRKCGLLLVNALNRSLSKRRA